MIILLASPLRFISANSNEVLVIDSDSYKTLDYANQNYEDDPDGFLSTINEILEQYPNNAMARQVKAKIYYRAIGDIERAMYELNSAEKYLKSIEESLNDIDQEYVKIYKMVRDEISYIRGEIDFDFTHLKFKVRGAQITKMARIEGVHAILQYNSELYQQATEEQKKRLDFLKNKLKNIAFQFSKWDSIEQEMYFEIKHFPLIFTDISDPYTLTINNEMRYHFSIIDENNPPIKIDWSTNYRLVESIPEMMIGIKHPKSIQLNPNYSNMQYVSSQPFSLEGEFDQQLNTYLPMLENNTVEIYISDTYPGKKIEEILYYLNKTLLLSLITYSFIMVR